MHVHLLPNDDPMHRACEPINTGTIVWLKAWFNIWLLVDKITKMGHQLEARSSIDPSLMIAALQ